MILIHCRFGLAKGCKIGKAKLFCVPATKLNPQVKTNLDPPAFPVEGVPIAFDQICYQIKCPKPFPEDQVVTDQFATRNISKLKPQLLCTPP